MTHLESRAPGRRLQPPHGALLQYVPVNPLMHWQVTVLPSDEQVPLLRHGFGLQLVGGDDDVRLCGGKVVGGRLCGGEEVVVGRLCGGKVAVGVEPISHWVPA